MGIRIDALPATALPSLAHEFPAMKDGLTVKLTLAQIAEVLGIEGLLQIAQNLADLDDPDEALANLGLSADAINVVKAANTAAMRAALGIHLPRSYLAGLTLSNNATDATNDIDVAAGECRDSTNTVDIILASALTKRLDAAWAVGSGNGGRMSAAAIADTTYHAYLIRRSDTGVIDGGFDVSATSPTLPANYDSYRLIGSVLRESGAIVAFVQDGDLFERKVPVSDVNATSGTTAALAPLSVPLGRKVIARISGNISLASTSTATLITDPDTTDTAPTLNVNSIRGLQSGASANGIGNAVLDVRTDVSARVRHRSLNASTSLSITTFGWIDRRGRDG